MGENDNCYGWMVGEAEVVNGRGIGMKQMFAYMNEERLNTGLFSLGCIGSAYYAALDYTKIRVQSKHSTNPKGPECPNLLNMKTSAACFCLRNPFWKPAGRLFTSPIFIATWPWMPPRPKSGNIMTTCLRSTTRFARPIHPIWRG